VLFVRRLVEEGVNTSSGDGACARATVPDMELKIGQLGPDCAHLPPNGLPGKRCDVAVRLGLGDRIVRAWIKPG